MGIKELIDGRVFATTARSYLSMSATGEQCLRKRWYGFRWALGRSGEHSARSERIFRRGDLEEPRIIADLNHFGVEVFRREGELRIPLRGVREEPQETLSAAHGHALGHPDGRLLGLPECPEDEILAEFKTMKASSFSAAVTNGVRISHPGYWWQVQRYMEAMGLPAALLIATNKDTEERIYEFIARDHSAGVEAVERELHIVEADEPPRPTESRDCVFCAYKEVCHGREKMVRGCKTCRFVQLCEGGEWRCSQDGEVLTDDKQEKGCRAYKRIQ